MSDNEHATLNLSPDEKRAFSFLFAQADKDQLGVVTGENAVTFFERTHVSPNVLGEIWQLADTENRGLLTKPGFCMVLRLIGHYQAGREPTTELAFKPGPIPKFEGLTIPGVGGAVGATGSGLSGPSAAGLPPAALQPQASGNPPVRVPPLDPQKVQQYSGLFERSGAQNGQLDGATAKAIFERAGLPNEVLGRIWMLADREQRGALDQTEFIVAMHMLTSMKTRTMTALPTTLPPGLYEAAARRGGPPPARQPTMPTAIPRQISGSSAGAIPRTQSPLARSGQQPPQATSAPWLITPADKSKFDQFFNSIDTQRRGVLTGEQAVTFFSDSRLPEETLAQIWDLADINSEGQLNKDEFAVAMYLIRQQRAPNPIPLPAFLPPGLVPPSMRKQQQQTQSTAPAFDNAANSSNLPKSAADDLFGLDEPSSPTIKQAPVLQPQTTGMSASRDPFSGGSPATPSSPQRFQAPQSTQAQPTGFKPFQPTSAFGASLASQNTGGSFASNQAATTRGAPPMPQSSGADDLLGDNDTSAAESGKLTNETSELANMSNQIGNLRSQMEQTQAKKSASQAESTTMNTQKRDLEIRLQQFRGQYEQEVRAVKELEQQLAASRDSTKKLSQELAMLEGSYQDLQTQHQKVSQDLQTDQQENANLKQRISEINAEVTRLKPEIEKLKLDARQQRGMVSINKKQLATGEGERDRLQGEKADLEREATEHAAQARSATFDYPEHSSNVVSPAASVMSANNPFFVKPSQSGDLSRSGTPITAPQTSKGPNPSAFDAILGPSAAFAPNGQSSGTSTPPATSFVGRNISSSAGPHGMSDSMQSVSSRGEHTPSATPPLPDVPKEAPLQAEPPPPPEEQQFSASHLPVVGVKEAAPGSDTSSLGVLPPASRASGVETPREEVPVSSEPTLATFKGEPTTESAAHEAIPGAFPEATPLEKELQPPTAAKDDFDSAFAGFGAGDKAAETRDIEEDPFAPSTSRASTNGVASEFPEIKYLEPEDSDSDDDTDAGFGDDFAAPAASTARAPVAAESVAPAVAALPPITAQTSPPTYEDSDKPSHGGTGEHTDENQFPPEFGGLLPAREDPTSPTAHADGPAAETSAREVEKENEAPRTLHTPFSSGTHAFPAPPGQAITTSAQPHDPTFDDFDAFDDLSEAKEADKASDLDFTFSEPSGADFNPAFDSPAASMSTTIASAQATPSASRTLPEPTSHGFSNFQPTASTTSVFASGGATSPVPATAQHDWDAIFSGLDSAKPVDTSLPASDPWGASPPGSSSAATMIPPPAASSSIPKPKGPDRGGALTPGTEHDDPILKRLTGMGYPRGEALDALEKYDYDINRAVDHLSGPP
ncbi:UBA/TS-N domain containing protein [Zymoseptoria brevis]|uniref:UBA/TS-N domain containing protein n=1 Tax=Zymoseptoria brevis TaxID=1047168 RepID=A0A0F4GIK2_9PEZI|nr:UBA/TS-N domain containing protein [Zymoseptoria brevis]